MALASISYVTIHPYERSLAPAVSITRVQAAQRLRAAALTRAWSHGPRRPRERALEAVDQYRPAGHYPARRDTGACRMVESGAPTRDGSWVVL